MKSLRIYCMALMAILLSVGFTACGDDDEDTNVPSEIIGTWYADTNITVTFNSNGTGYVTETSDGKTETSNFTFTYDITTLVLTINEDGDTYTYTNVIIKNTTLTLTDERGYTTSWTKNGSNTNTDDENEKNDDNGGTSGDNTTSGNLLTSITYSGSNLLSMEYDSKGRITTFQNALDNVKVYYSYDESGKLEAMKQWDEDQWEYFNNIKFTSEGYIKSFHYYEDDGYSGNATFDYDSNGHLTRIYAKESDGEETVFTSTWDNGCLINFAYEETVVVDDPDGPDSYNSTFTYSNETNDKKCYTAYNTLMPELFLAGFVGKGSDYLPNSVTDDEDTYKLSYKKDTYGKILMETAINNNVSITLYYNYGASSNSNAKLNSKAAKTKQSNIKLPPTMHSIFGKTR